MQYYDDEEALGREHCIVDGIPASLVDWSNSFDYREFDKLWEEGRDKGQYESFLDSASHLPDVQKRIEEGESLDSIREDPSLSQTVSAYYDRPLQVSETETGYELMDDGRHRINAAQDAHVTLPVEICNPGQYHLENSKEHRQIDDYYNNVHSYGKEDYPTYSKDPEWQRLNRNYNRYLQGTGKEPEESAKNVFQVRDQFYRDPHQIQERQNQKQEMENGSREQQDEGRTPQESQERMEDLTSSDQLQAPQEADAETMGHLKAENHEDDEKQDDQERMADLSSSDQQQTAQGMEGRSKGDVRREKPENDINQEDSPNWSGNPLPDRGAEDDNPNDHDHDDYDRDDYEHDRRI